MSRLGFSFTRPLGVRTRRPHRFSNFWVALLLLGLLPGSPEVVESAVHLVTEGHLAHAEATDDHHEPIDVEHGCTPLYHFCFCHSGLSFLVASEPVPATRFEVAVLDGPLGPEAPASEFVRSIDRPPRV